MSGPLVSVVIPFLDPRPEFFQEAVASVVAQTWRPLELILVNDGSGPRAVELAKRLVGSSGVPTRYLEHAGGENRGISATRNLGAAAATGEYLAFLDADDVWDPAKLNEQVQVLQRFPDVALVFGRTRYWYSWQPGGPADFVVGRGTESERILPPPRFVVLFIRGRIIVPSASNTMIRRRAYHDCGGFEESFRGMYEDQAFLVKLGLGHPVMEVPNIWDSYRQHPDSMTSQSNDSGAENAARKAFLEWAGEYCSANATATRDVREAVRKEMWLAANADGLRALQRLRRWWLRLEESLLPGIVRQRIWCRDSAGRW